MLLRMLRFTCVFLVCAALLEGASRAAPAPCPPVGGQCAHEVRGYLSYLDADPFGLIAHDYAVAAIPGATVEVELVAAFDPYVEVFDESGGFIADGDDPSGEGTVRIAAGPLKEGAYTIRVTSAAGDETGGYVLRLRPAGAEGASPEEAVAQLVRLPADREGVLLFGELAEGAMFEATLPAGARAAEFSLAVPGEGAAWVDVWLFSDFDFDLFAGAHAGGTILQDGASRGAYGYEHVALALPAGAEAVTVRAVLYDNYDGDAPFQILARSRGAGAAELDPGDLGAGTAVRSGAYAGRLEPGVRYRAEIRPGAYGTQHWAFVVPDGAQRIEVGLFDADQDLDLSVEPGWAPSPRGAEHALQSATRRWNDRIVIDAGAAVLTAGVYTVAVWPGGGRNTLDLEGGATAEPRIAAYGIQLAVDEPLPSSSSYAGVTGSDLAAMSGIDRARLAAVWIESDFRWGAGAIVSPSGLILTNYNVVSDCHPGDAATVGCLAEDPADRPWYLAGEHLVWMVDAESGAARQAFVAEVVDVLPELDLALLKIVSDLDGRPVEPVGTGGDAGGAVFPYLLVDRPDPANRRSSPGRIVALGFPEGAFAGRVASQAVDRALVDYVSGPPGVYVVEAGGPPWHSGMLVVAPEQGMLLGLVTERHRLRGDESWVMVPAALVPASWLAKGIAASE